MVLVKAIHGITHKLASSKGRVTQKRENGITFSHTLRVNTRVTLMSGYTFSRK